MKAIDGFINPFEIERKENLFSLVSGAAVNALIKSDVLGTEEPGKTEYETFMKSRIIDKTLEFHAPIKTLKLETFKSTAKSCQGARRNSWN